MPKYFGRQYRIEFSDDAGNVSRVIDSRDIARAGQQPFQIEFFVDVSFGAALSKMELSIYGLKKDSVGQIAGSSRVDLQVGYPDAFGRIFHGRISNFIAPRDGVERKITMWCWSGIKEKEEKTCNVSFAEGTKYSDIVDYIAQDLFNRAPEYIGFDDSFRSGMGTATDGYSGNYPHSSFLDRLAADLKFQWMVQNEKCLLMSRGASRGGAPYEINAETGLVGGVSLTYLGADIETKLDPRIVIGDRVKIQAETSTINFSAIYSVSLPEKKRVIGDGNYVVKALRRKGSFYGQNSWNTQMVCWREGETGLREDGLPYGQ